MSPEADRWIWHFSPNGNFSTSSAFRLARRKPLSKRKSSASPLDSALWHSVWTLPVLPKLRFFLWRVIHRILPVREELLIKHVHLDPTCPVCLDKTESVEHLLFDCSLSRRLSDLNGLPRPIDPTLHPAIFWRSIMNSNPGLGPNIILLWWRLWKS
ncbi:Putative ribonuclease H protein At1g65750 [Linum grandiflorum]